MCFYQDKLSRKFKTERKMIRKQQKLLGKKMNWKESPLRDTSPGCRHHAIVFRNKSASGCGMEGTILFPKVPLRQSF